MMDFNMMGGNGGSGMMFFAWITYLIVNVALVYAILCMAKYLKKP
jgi:hypothetical protein